MDTPYEKIKVCSTLSRIDEERLFEGIEHLSLLVKGSGDADAALAILERLVPDFRREPFGDEPADRVASRVMDGHERPRHVEH